MTAKQIRGGNRKHGVKTDLCFIKEKKNHSLTAFWLKSSVKKKSNLVTD